jgi:hypothetical protein|tara:strand:- start:2412 stop:2834 length:423 start_codon:yes stop_codon:yes gene_type:complete
MVHPLGAVAEWGVFLIQQVPLPNMVVGAVQAVQTQTLLDALVEVLYLVLAEVVVAVRPIIMEEKVAHGVLMKEEAEGHHKLVLVVLEHPVNLGVVTVGLVDVVRLLVPLVVLVVRQVGQEEEGVLETQAVVLVVLEPEAK